MAIDESKLLALGKILRQEQSNGFRDSTVFGGLDKFLERWTDELAPALEGMDSYSGLSPSEREAWSESVVSRLGNQMAGPAKPRPSGSTTPRPQPARSPQRPSLHGDVSLLGRERKETWAALKRLGVRTVEDLILHYPRRHNDFSDIKKVAELVVGQDQTVLVTVLESSVTGYGPGRKSTHATLGDDTGNVRAIWFGQQYMARTLTPGTQVVISGRPDVFRGRFTFKSPDYELLSGQEDWVHAGRLVPVYPSTERLYQRTLRRLTKRALDVCAGEVEEFLPEKTRHRIGLMGQRDATVQMHFPDSRRDWEVARRRLAFDELLLMQMMVFSRKRGWQEDGVGVPLSVDDGLLDTLLTSLPYTLTNSQRRALDDVLKDIQHDRPMGRLLQGEVGSGKTAVAMVALLVAAFDGHQGAFMAPTEILAEQHFLGLAKLLSGLDIQQRDEYVVSVGAESLDRQVSIGLLVGSMAQGSKDAMRERASDGDVDIVIGTQALIQDGVDIPGLALVVVDEQHRFGVTQRASLREKGVRPHLLAMSATPIPRSLALTLHGDLDLTTIDELPPGRQEIRTRWLAPEGRDGAYEEIRRQVREGRQAFIVCPFVEESDAIQTRAATEEHRRLSSDVFQDLTLDLLHGRMSLAEKDEVMGRFQRGETQVLVATPVVEVGIDVPNATVMLVDGAERFGLAQLHQLRGRVGRGTEQGYCLLLSDSPGEEARERLKTVEHIADGFRLADEDLRLRGPGDYFGTRQSGLANLRAARITDTEILDLARQEAARLFETDPLLTDDGNAALARRFRDYDSGHPGEFS